MTVRRTRLRTAAVGASLVLGVGALGGCSGSEGPEAGAVTTADLQGVEDQLGALEERVGVLEEEGVGVSGTATGEGAAFAGADNEEFFADEQALVGQEVTISAEVSEMVTTTDVGSAFRVAGDGDADPVAVIAPDSSVQVDQDDVLRITGTVVQVMRDSFEQDFGVAADELFTDADAFFSEAEGGVGINASQVEVLQEQADQS